MNTVSKGMTYSVRVPRKIANQFDRLSELMQINKSDFMRACIEKLCKDNRLYLEHADKTKQYVEFIKAEMSKLSEDMIVVKNGLWKDVTDVAVLMLCDLLFKWSSKVFDLWFELIVSYGLSDEDYKARTREDFADGLIELSDFGFILSPAKVPVDVDELLTDETWWDSVENKKVSLLYTTKKAIEQYSAEYIIKEVLEKTTRIEREPTIIVVDAAGKFRRSGSTIITPAECVKVSKAKSETNVASIVSKK